jgi:hypothetical protein
VVGGVNIGDKRRVAQKILRYAQPTVAIVDYPWQHDTEHLATGAPLHHKLMGGCAGGSGDCLQKNDGA